MSGIIVLMLSVMQLSGQYQTHFPGQSPIEMFTIVVAPLIIWFFGIRSIKILQKGKLTFKQGLLEGIKISLVFGVVSPFIFAAYYYFVNPEIVGFVRDAYQLGNDSSFESVVMADMIAQFLFSLIFGTIYSAVISFFLKSKSK